MKLKLVAVFASVLLVATGAAVAMPGSAPDHAQDGTAQADDHARDEHANDANDSDASEAGGENASAADEGVEDNDSDARRGPPVDLPAQVPDFVSDIHETIGSHVGGAVDGARSLGERLSELTPDDGADAGNGTDAPDGATATPAA